MKRSELDFDPMVVIHSIRGEKVIFDTDLAKMYGVSTSHLNQAVTRNIDRFPSDFRFRLTDAEWEVFKSRQTKENPLGGGRQKLPWAFTEHGALMAANVLRSERAIQMSVFVIRAFIRMRNLLSDTSALAAKLDKLEREVTSRLDSHEKAIVELMRQFLSIINPESAAGDGGEASSKREIGFHVKDRKRGADVQSKSNRAR
jgi:hypothetical protein